MSTYGIRFNSFQDAKRFKYAFLEIQRQSKRYKSIFILQLIRAVELMLFMMKLDRNLIFLAADNNQL